eukprot:CAMPEP_0197439372 /NCGR_PEP_ID=MMETSP1175-20131217/6130_1 /TAXON_ID=1003142 /ORGANISM="Triceratium dubium, Strain CCMP147" /LENGTH=303 /DNA_ID=CAMNT_0042969281 /DNA_START=222 /DNA_END=1133 /DNA_ORIENTATION=-
MQSALGLALEAQKPSGSFIGVPGHGSRGLHVADGLVPSIVQRIVRNVVLLDVLPNLIVRPVRQRIDLDSRGIVVIDLEHVQVRPFAPLRRSSAGNPSGRSQLLERAKHRLDLDDPVVLVRVGTPEVRPVLGHEGGLVVEAEGTELAQAHVVEVGLDSVDEVVRFGEEVEGVEGYGRDGAEYAQLGHLVKDDHSRRAERRDLDEFSLRAALVGPQEDVVQVGQVRVEMIDHLGQRDRAVLEDGMSLVEVIVLTHIEDSSSVREVRDHLDLHMSRAMDVRLGRDHLGDSCTSFGGVADARQKEQK